MRIKHLTPLFFLGGMLSLHSCIDNDYDLSDVDTTVGVNVKDLVIPVNLEPVMLDNMLDIEEGDRIEKLVIDGETIYAVVEKGTFESGDIDIAPMSINKPTMPSIKDKLTVNASDKLTAIPALYDGIKFNALAPYFDALGLSEDAQLVHLEILNTKENIHFEANDLDHSLVKVGHIGVLTDFNVTLEFPGMNSVASAYHINNLKVQLPKGLETTNPNYDKATGLLSYDKIDAGNDLKVQIALHITGIDADLAGATLLNHNFNFSQEVYATGSIDLYLKDINQQLSVGELRELTQIDYKCDAHFDSDIDVLTFSGDIRYDVESPRVDPVDLSDLPEILQQTGTRIEMSNPQIYVSVTNPIDEKHNINPKAKLALVPNMKNDKAPFAETIQMTGAKSVFCLAPSKPKNYFKDGSEHDYSTATYQPFSNLGQILACNNGSGYAIPTSIGIDIDVATIEENDIKDFELKHYGKVKGTYAFVAPLALTDASRVCYDKVWDDWGDEDLDALTVRSAYVTADVTSDIPAEIAAQTEAYLLGRDERGNTVRLKGTAYLPANANNHPMVIKLDEGQPVSRIYGMELKVRAAGSNGTLAPTQKISVKNLKIKLSGYYEKEL